MKHMTPFTNCLFTIIVLCSATIILSCSGMGLLTEESTPEIYSVPKLLPDGPFPENPKFIVYGDIRPGHRIVEKFGRKENWRTWKMALVPFYQLYWLGNGIVGGIDLLRKDTGYGSGARAAVRNALLNEAKSIHADFIVNTGDFVSDGRYPDHWLRFIKENKFDSPLLTEIPYLPTSGSHESTNDSVYGRKNYSAIFGYPGFYTMEFPDADLFVIDSNIILDQKQFIEDDRQDELFDTWIVSPVESERVAWLERKLAESDKPFKIVSMHHTPVSFGHHHGDWQKASYGKNLSDKRKRLLKLFQKYGVQIVFCGHEHLYEHNILRYTKECDSGPGEVHLIVTGGGGVPLRDKNDSETIGKYLDYYRSEGFDIIQEKNQEIYHFCVITVENDRVSIEVKEVTGDSSKPVRAADSIVIHK